MTAPTDEWPMTVVGGPWPDRIGLRCREVPPLAPTYPWAGLGAGEVVVLIERDPLRQHHSTRRWSCVLSRSNLAASSGGVKT